MSIEKTYFRFYIEKQNYCHIWSAQSILKINEPDRQSSSGTRDSITIWVYFKSLALQIHNGIKEFLTAHLQVYS